MLYSCASIFSEMAQASPTKHSLYRCNCDLYVFTISPSLSIPSPPLSLFLCQPMTPSELCLHTLSPPSLCHSYLSLTPPSLYNRRRPKSRYQSFFSSIGCHRLNNIKRIRTYRSFDSNYSCEKQPLPRIFTMPCSHCWSN